MCFLTCVQPKVAYSDRMCAWHVMRLPLLFYSHAINTVVLSTQHATGMDTVNHARAKYNRYPSVQVYKLDGERLYATYFQVCMDS